MFPPIKLLLLWMDVRRVRRTGGKAELVQALRKLAERQRWLPGGRSSAVAHYEEAVALCRELNDPLLLAHTVRHLGDLHHDQSRSAPAEVCYDEAIALYRQHGYGQPLNFANAIRRLAVLKEEQSNYALAQRYWQEAHDLYVAAAEPMGIAESAAWLALLAKRHGDPALSREWLGRASAAAEASRHHDSLVWVRKVKEEVEG